MSFILDALKKSESDRQRQGGPALFEVKVAAPRHALPPWAVAIGVLFVANLAIVAWLLLRHTATPAEVAPPAQVAARAPAETATPAPAAAPTVAAMNAPAAGAPAPGPAARGTVAAPAAATAASAPGAAAASDLTPEPGSNPDDFAPAAEPPPAGNLGRVKRGTDAGVPLYQQAASAQGSQIPQLRLDLHAYAERAGDRWVLINMHRLREGESFEGVRVERITPEGAVLSYRGSQFLLTQ